jgi:ketosteroid isomerase-like protein
MSAENVELVERMFGLWNGGDVDGWLECWHEDAEWVSEPFAAFEGQPRVYRGHEGLRRFPADALEGFADLGQIERLDCRDLGDSVLALGDYRVKAEEAGPEVVTPMAWLVEIRAGKIARGRDFVDQAEALEAIVLERRSDGGEARPG